MARVVYVHWNEEEGKPAVRALRGEGHAVLFHWTQIADADAWRRMKESLPEAMVISLARLPSHGRRVAEWFWEAEYRRAVPVLFVGGAPEKVALVKKRFPEAVFTSGERLLADLASALARSPVAPKS
ncbi:MAG TPA: hypothetical protein VFI25_19285 [Planctomycetota bacterium]|jgi:hypothetical protein|nr:hypothetical protein [Planctomycetota bacterium]